MENEKPNITGHLKAVPSKFLDNEIRKLTKDLDTTSIDLIKSFAQTVHMLQGFISEKEINSDDFFEWLKQFPPAITDRIYYAFLLTDEIYRCVSNSEEQKESE